MLAVIQAAKAVAVRDRGTGSPGYIISATVPAPVALALLKLDAALKQVGIDPLLVGGQATFELDLDADRRPRQVRMSGTDLALDDMAVELPPSIAGLADASTFRGSFSDYGTEVSIPLPNSKT